MLTQLRIENYALIDRLDISFPDGLTAITGETGAGKSILMDAFDLVLGKRADTQVLLDPSRKCLVEAVFDISTYNLESFFTLAGLDYDRITIMRREILPGGKSRAFINDTPVNLNQLKALGDALVDIHAQHATTSLQDPRFQLSVIDHFAGLQEELAGYRELYQSCQDKERKLKDLTEAEKSGRATFDFKSYQLEELVNAALKEDEQALLEERQTILKHAGEISAGLYAFTELFQAEEKGIVSQLSEAAAVLKKVSGFYPGLETLLERLESDTIDLKDIMREIESMSDKVEHSPEEMQRVQERLDLIYRLEHKHLVNSVAELVQIRDRLQSELDQYASLEEEIAVARKSLDETRTALQLRSGLISGKRKEAFRPLEEAVTGLLIHMGMPDCRFETRLEPLPEPGPEGQDRIEFYFNANLGHALKPLASVASGGELSRLMLSIKSLLSERKKLPTIVFDEIDNGLSGDIAGRVGEVLVRAASRMQVIVITHLPQIAGKARHQFAVYKHTDQNMTFSRIRQLNTTERMKELAKMIGGNDISEATLQAAREMLTFTS